jgi:hypothetical protein
MKKLLKIYFNEWNKAQKNSLTKLSLQADISLFTCQKIVRKKLNFYSHKITSLQELRPGDSEKRLEYCNWFLNNLNDDRFLIMNLNFFNFVCRLLLIRHQFFF